MDSFDVIGFSLFFAFLILVYFFSSISSLKKSKLTRNEQKELSPLPTVSSNAFHLPMETILFSAGITKLNAEQKSELKQFATLPKELFLSHVLAIQGLADASGNHAENRVLAKSRAQNVHKYLISIGLSTENLKILSPEVIPGENRIMRERLRSVQFQWMERNYPTE